MRRSRHVAAPLLAAADLSMTSSCRKPEMQRVVDRTYNSAEVHASQTLRAGFGGSLSIGEWFLLAGILGGAIALGAGS